MTTARQPKAPKMYVNHPFAHILGEREKEKREGGDVVIRDTWVWRDGTGKGEQVDVWR
jgi:hypothetical protein